MQKIASASGEEPLTRGTAARRMLKNLHDIIDTPLHLVYSAPKTGSTTVAATLNRANPRGHTIHLHVMGNLGFARLQRLADAKRRPHVWQKQINMGLNTRALVEAKRAIRQSAPLSFNPPEKIFVVIGVRDPIAMHFSFMFECHWHYVDAVTDFTPDSLERSIVGGGWHEWANAWFDEELLEVLGVDYREHPFPHEKGYQQIETDLARILIVRTENLASLPTALGELHRASPEDFPLECGNVTIEQPGGREYTERRDRMRLAPNVLEAAYNLPYVKHFYTEAERADFIRKWTREDPEV